MQADTRRVAGNEVQIGAAPAHDLLKKLIDLRHEVRAQPPVGWTLVASRRGIMLVSVTNFWNIRLSLA